MTKIADDLAIEAVALAHFFLSNQGCETLQRRLETLIAKAFKFSSDDWARFIDNVVEFSRDAGLSRGPDWFAEQLEMAAEETEINCPDGRVRHAVCFIVSFAVQADESVPAWLSPRALEALEEILRESSVIGEGAHFELLPTLHCLQNLIEWSARDVFLLCHSVGERIALGEGRIVMPPTTRVSPQHLEISEGVKCFGLVGVALMTDKELERSFPDIYELSEGGASEAGFTSDGRLWADIFADQLRETLGLKSALCEIAAPRGYFLDIPIALDMSRYLALSEEIEQIKKALQGPPSGTWVELQPEKDIAGLGVKSIVAVMPDIGKSLKALAWPLYRDEEVTDAATAFTELLEESGFQVQKLNAYLGAGQFHFH